MSAVKIEPIQLADAPAVNAIGKLTYADKVTEGLYGCGKGCNIYKRLGAIEKLTSIIPDTCKCAIYEKDSETCYRIAFDVEWGGEHVYWTCPAHGSCLQKMP